MKTREEQVEEIAQVIDNATTTALNTLGSHNNGRGVWYAEKLYDAGYRKQSDTVREFVKKIGKVAFEMYLTAKDAYQGRNQAEAQQAYGAMGAITKLMAQIIVLAAECGAEVEE